MAPARGGVSLLRLLLLLLLVALAAGLGEEQQPAQLQRAAAQPLADEVGGSIWDIARPSVEEPAAARITTDDAESVVGGAGTATGTGEFQVAEGGQDKEGQGHGEAPHGEGLDEEAHHVSRVEYTVALLVFGFLVFNMILLCCMNYPDPDMRSNVRGMISSTISIFSAVPFNQAVLSLTVDQLMKSPPPRGLGMTVTHRERAIVGMVLFILFWTILNQFGRLLRKHKDANTKYAVKMISGHVTAFAGIFAFDNLATGKGALGEDVPVAVASVLVPTVAVGSLMLALWLSSLWRYSIPEDEEDEDDGEGDENWEEEVEEAEMDAATLICSYVVQMIILRVITGRPIAFSAEAHLNWSQVFWLLVAGVGFLSLVVASVFFKRIPRSTHHLAKMGQMCFSMCMSWCFLRVSEQWMFDHISQPSVAQCSNALTMTCLSLCAIRLLDCIADDIREDRRKAFEAQVKEHNLHHGPDPGFRAETGDLVWEALLRSKTNDLLMHQEKALRRVIDGFGLLVGLSWERAFDICGEALIEGRELTREHAVIAKILLAVLVLCVVVPAWVWYIVPTARLTRHQHDMLMKKEAETATLLRYNFRKHLPEGADPCQCVAPCSDSDATDDTEDNFGASANGARPGPDPTHFLGSARDLQYNGPGVHGVQPYLLAPGGPMMAAGPAGMAGAQRP